MRTTPLAKSSEIERKWYIIDATYGELLANNPVKMVEISVKGMLPKNTLGHQEFLKMHVYAGEDHKHEAQKPEKLDINKLI